MLLSIVIPLYNNEAYLTDCLDSILLQNLNEDDYELVIVNDGSVDSSEAIAVSYRDKFKNFNLINQQNKGNGIARENGLKEAKGIYIFFMDSDDYLVTGSLQEIMKLASPENLDVIRFNAKKTFESLNRNQQPETVTNNKAYKVISGLQFLAKNYYAPEVWHYFVKKELLIRNDIKFVKDHYIQDSFYTPLIYVNAKKTVDTRLDVYRYRQNIGSVTKKKSDAHIKKYNESITYGIERIGIIREQLNPEEAFAKDCNRMLKIKQQWYCTLWIVRFARSSNDTRALNNNLKKMKLLGAFPLKDLKEGPYANLKYKLIRITFNNTLLRNLFVHVYRKYYQLRK